MNDCEDYIFDTVRKAVLAAYSNASIASEYIQTPAKFPHISLWAHDNTPAIGKQTNGKQEAVSTLAFTVNVYSNLRNRKKSEAKRIMELIDAELYKLNCIRTSYLPVPNMLDITIYRLTATYRVDYDGVNLYRS